MAVYPYKYCYEDPAKGCGEPWYTRKGDFGDIAAVYCEAAAVELRPYVDRSIR